MDCFPTEIILHIITFLYDVKDKIELSYTNRFMYSLLSTNSNCWSPLDLSLHRGNINNIILLNILRTRSIKIITPWQQKQKQKQQKEIDEPQQQHAYINEINLSGCCFISCDAILTVVSTLSFLTTLHLNRYAPISIPESLHYHPRYYIQTKSIMIDMLRDEVYQQRPRHGLSSTNHDLSKQPFTPFNLPDTTLRQILQLTPHLKDLAIQSQQISKETCEAMGQLIPHLCHLDISSCDISVSHLQILLRTIGRQLVSLKMLNIDLSNLTILSLLHYGASTLECLHLSCIDPQFLPSLTQLVSHLSVLKDFRLTRLRSGNIDYLIHALATRPLIKYIDMSPKLELYPKLLPLSASSSSSTSSSSSASATTPSNSSYNNSSSNHSTKYHQHHNHHSKASKKNISPSSSSSLSSARTGFLRRSSTIDKIKTAKGITNNKHHFSSTSNNDGSSSSSSSSASSSSPPSSILLFTRAEYDLNMTPATLFKLSSLPYLVELRLCFPTIDATSLCHFFETTTSPLRVLELRLKENKEEQHKKEKHHHHTSTESHYYQYKPFSSSLEKDPSLPKDDFLKHINRLTQLHTLYLYGVPINQSNIDMIATMYSLQSMVLDHCGKLGHFDPCFLRKWLISLPRLKMVRMNCIPYLESTVKDLFHLTATTITETSSSSSSSLTTEIETETTQMKINIMGDGGSSNISHNHHQIRNEMEPFYFGDSMFVRSNGKWEWVD